MATAIPLVPVCPDWRGARSNEIRCNGGHFRRRLRTNQDAVLEYMYLVADGDRSYVYEGTQREIADSTAIPQRTVRRILGELERQDLVRRLRQGRHNCGPSSWTFVWNGSVSTEPAPMEAPSLPPPPAARAPAPIGPAAPQVATQPATFCDPLKEETEVRPYGKRLETPAVVPFLPHGPTADPRATAKTERPPTHPTPGTDPAATSGRPDPQPVDDAPLPHRLQVWLWDGRAYAKRNGLSEAALLEQFTRIPGGPSVGSVEDLAWQHNQRPRWFARSWHKLHAAIKREHDAWLEHQRKPSAGERSHEETRPPARPRPGPGSGIPMPAAIAKTFPRLARLLKQPSEEREERFRRALSAGGRDTVGADGLTAQQNQAWRKLQEQRLRLEDEVL